MFRIPLRRFVGVAAFAGALVGAQGPDAAPRSAAQAPAVQEQTAPGIAMYLCNGNRGLGMWGQYLYMDTPDQHLVSLEAATGKERWNQRKADHRGDLYATTAPTVIGNRVLTPAGGDYTDVPGWLESRDPETGALQWKWYATPRAGEPGIETWPNASPAR